MSAEWNPHAPGAPNRPFALALDRLAGDLIGPPAEGDVITDVPSDRFVTGVLFPLRTEEDEADIEDGDPATDEPEDAPSARRETAVRPSAAGLSFSLDVPDGVEAAIEVEITAARYGPEMRNGTEPLVWHRKAIHGDDLFPLPERIRDHDLGETFGADFADFKLTLVALPTSDGTVTVTAAVASTRMQKASGKGSDTSRLDINANALFEFMMRIRPFGGSRFVPRPIARAAADETDAEVNAAALLWRDCAEYATGHTCAAHWVETAGTVEEIRTAWLPATLVEATSAAGATAFHGLGDALEAGRLAEGAPAEVAAALMALVAAYREWISGERRRIDGDVPQHLVSQARDHLGVCEEAVERMAAGIAALRELPALMTAFQLANRAMALQYEWSQLRRPREPTVLTWRPFQLAFVLLALTSTAERNDEARRTMDLVWFPTGGGKTEAYLLLTAFAIFARRLRHGDEAGAGVTVLMRYTLRLLTIQQFERAAAMILAAEIVRREHRGSIGGAQIGLGLWLGSATTPNKVAEAAKSDGTSTHAQLTRCPCCDSPLTWTVHLDRVVVHCPENAGCEVGALGELPISTVDEDVYRVRPSLVIGTADKFAQVARNPNTAALFGAGGLPSDLIVQDELHLISGPLGTMAALYECAIDALCAVAGRGPKIVGSTATIRRAGEQVRRLFDRATFQFPPPGLDATNSGFAVGDPARSGRLYVGVTTAGRSKQQVLQVVAASLLQSARAAALTARERDALWTLVSYHNSLRELGGSVTLMRLNVEDTMNRLADTRGEERFHVPDQIEVTSRIASAEIGSVLKRLEKTCASGEAVDVALATNMISVGVDVDRLGLMLVDGQPKGIAEYIQATSRVGRSATPGLVVGIYSARRARDRSRYETHRTWHQALYRDVEPTVVTPFAPRARDRALHAPFVALCAHRIPDLFARPELARAERATLAEIADAIVARARSVDADEAAAVAAALAARIEEWCARDPSTWWADSDPEALLMSAEWAAQRKAGRRMPRRAWPTPNSLRGVEATVNIELEG